MHYKTMVLELLRQRPQVYDQLKSRRLLLPALDRYAAELKASHEAWRDRLSRAKPGSAPSQIASEAMEMALTELEGRLPPESSTAGAESLSLDSAMALLRRHTPPE